MARSVCHVSSVPFIHPSIHPCLSVCLHIFPSVAKCMVCLWNWATFMLLPWNFLLLLLLFLFFSQWVFWHYFGDFDAILTARFLQNVIGLVLVVIGLDLVMIGLLLGSSSAGFVTQTWQLCLVVWFGVIFHQDSGVLTCLHYFFSRFRGRVSVEVQNILFYYNKNMIHYCRGCRHFFGPHDKASF